MTGTPAVVTGNTSSVIPTFRHAMAASFLCSWQAAGSATTGNGIAECLALLDANGAVTNGTNTCLVASDIALSANCKTSPNVFVTGAGSDGHAFGAQSHELATSAAAKTMVFTLVTAASRTRRRLKGTNQLPKVAGVGFNDGIEIIQELANQAPDHLVVQIPNSSAYWPISQWRFCSDY
ncbi:hypothetical protein ACKWRH_08070 [Bradyrhizobium sp. Pa8]|uniref:hypothetical protein n=1 Tax=Bradyrhizobium sp. Pa8 TaxID=3386552 RepID=UPI00403FC19B